MYVITGATGNVGSKVAANLQAKGKPVRMLGRSEEKLKSIFSNKAEFKAGDILNSEYLTGAFTGATAVFAIIPPNMGAPDSREYQHKAAETIASAVEKAGVKRVVLLSSVGAHRADGVGIVGGLHDFEERMKKIKGLNLVILRPAYFMENTLMAINTIRSMNLIALPVEPELRYPMIATQDVAEAATDYLLDESITGTRVQYLLGSRDVSYNDVTRIYSEALGNGDLKYIKAGYDDMKSALTGMGVSESVADDYLGLVKGINEGRLYEDARRNPYTTTRTSIEDFSKTFASAYKG